MNENVLRVNGLHKGYRKQPVLQGLDFELAPGKVTVLLGANGSGKSTFFKLALGLLLPEKGTISVLGFDPRRQARQLRQQVGFVPSIPDAYEWMTVEDLFRLLEPQYPTWDRQEADRLCEELSVPRKRSFKKMSRGEGMKAMLAAALVPNPDLLLLDEPFGGLDPMARDEVLERIISETRIGERSLLCATHDLEIASRIADRVAILKDGRIADHGAVSDVLGKEAMKPRDLQAAMAGKSR